MSALRERFVAAPRDGSPSSAAGPASPPAEGVPRRADGATSAPPPVLGVLAAPPLTAPAGAAVALAEARLMRASAALACLWTPESAAAPPSVRGPVLPGARRLGAAIAARGHETAVAGRLVLVRLAGDEADAAAEAVRALAAAGSAAAVLAIGARSEILDGVLAGHDGLVLWPDPAAPSPLAGLALASLRALGPRAVEVPARLGAGGRALALAGLAAPAAATAAVREALA